MHISCCMDMMFSYCDFYARFAKIKAAGINTVEFWKWSNKDIDRIAAELKRLQMQVSIFNMDSTDADLSYALSRGILNAGDSDSFLSALQESIPVYKALGARGMIVLIGENAAYSEQHVLACLQAALPVLEKENIQLLVEPLNNTDRAGYAMPYATPVLALLRKLHSPRVKMLYDIYHQSMMGDFDMDEIRENIDLIGHFHVADAPGRHEPGTGTVDYVRILREISKTGYTGCVGLEYRATIHDEETLGFLKESFTDA